MNKTITAAVVAAVVFGGGGYYLGSSQASAASTAATSARTGSTGGGYAGRTGGAGRFGGAGATFGTIIAKDATSITVQLQQTGTSTSATQTGTKIVLYDPSTQIMKTAAGTSADLVTGQTVTVAGTSNSDGSVTATSIQLRPAMTRPAGAAPTTGQ